MQALAALVTGRRGRWAVIAVWLVLAVAATPLSMRLPDVTKDAILDFIPSGAQSLEVSELLDARFEGGDQTSVVLVYRRDGGLERSDREAILEQAAAAFELELASPGLVPFGRRASPELVAEEGDTALVVVPLEQAEQRDTREAIDGLREITAGSPPGLDASVTGLPALEIDNVETREESDATLFAVTAGLVLTLLIAIYRSPVIAMAPLLTVGMAYTVATGILYLLAQAGLTVTGTSRSLLLVLMFGATTDYCLLLVARYAEDLRSTEREADAMRVALPRAGPAIIASGATTITALLALVLAKVGLISSLGPVNAIGLSIGLLAAISLLPAMISVLGRRGFWPSAGSVAYRPKRQPALLPGLRPLDLPETPLTDQHPAVRRREGVWRRVGVRVVQRPVISILAVFALLGLGALGLTQLETVANSRADIKTETDGTRGFDILAERFPAGALGPATVLVERPGGRVGEADVAAVREQLEPIEGIREVSPPTAEARDGSAVTINVVFDDDPFANRAIDRVDEIRDRLETLGEEPRAIVGGPPAITADFRQGTDSDFRMLVPVVLGVIFLIMVALLRAIVAPFYIMLSTFLSFFGILGLAVVLSKALLGESDFNTAYPVFAFIFLVALGVDYNMFLMDRVREESAEHGTREGALRALVATGPVITSAGLILAGTFAALITVPTSTLQTLGLTVALGVLIDTFFVRTLFMPAIIVLIGDASWWPSKLSKGAGRSIPGAGSGISPLQTGVHAGTGGPVATAQPIARRPAPRDPPGP